MKLVAGDFLPDLPDYGSPGLGEAVNVYAGLAGYRPVGQFYAHTNALPSPCKGAASFIAPSGRVVLIAGTATKLYRQNGTTWAEIGLAPPVLNAPSTGTTGGTLAAATYYYKITAITAVGETVASSEVSQATTGAASTVTLTWAAVSGATGYRIYRGTAAGLESVYYAAGAVTTFTDTGAASTAGTPPTSSPTYTMPTGGRWRFVQFGRIAIVSNANNPPLKVDLETDAVALLGGNPPKMQAMAVVGEFVVGTQTNGAVNEIAWSGENDAEWWTYAQRKSDYNDFPDGGEVTGIIGGNIGLVLQRNAVRRMSYIGGNVLFRFDKISSNAGCASVHTVAQHGEIAFWYSEGGFKMWDGSQIIPIGQGRVDEAFAGLYEIVNLDKVSTAIDAQRSTVAWSTGYRIWLYNWLLPGADQRPGRWTVIDYSSEIITQRATRAPSLEEQDPAVGTPDNTLDGGLDSFDAARFRAGDPVFYVFNNGVMGTFNGTNMEARFTDRQRELIEGRDARVRRLRPMTDATGGVTVRFEARQRLGDAPRRKDFTTLQASGEMPVRNRGRFLKSRLSIAVGQDWTFFQGVDATLDTGGKR